MTRTLYSETANNTERMNSNYCSKRKTNAKGEIQEYIKYKQKLDKEKRFETEMTIQSRKNNIRSSLNNLQNFHHDRFNQYKSSMQTHARNSNENYYMVWNLISYNYFRNLPLKTPSILLKSFFLLYYINLPMIFISGKLKLGIICLTRRNC